MTAQTVLSLDDAEIPSFVRRCLKDRSLSWLIAQQNEALFSGTKDERDEAHKALTHTGVI